jgi:hypothetical protein
MSESDTGRGKDANEASIVDLLVVVMRKRRLIMGITALGLVLAAIFVLLGRFAPVVTKGDSAHSARLLVLAIEPDLGTAALAFSRGPSFEKAIEAAAGRPLTAEQLAKRVSVSLDEDRRTLIIIGKGRDAATAGKIAQAAYDNLERILGAASGDVYNSVAAALRKESLSLARQLPRGNAYQDLSGKLLAAANATSQRILMEAYARSIATRSNEGDPIGIVLDSVLKTYQQLEAKAIDDLAADERPAGTLSKSTADRLDALVSSSLGDESRLFGSIVPAKSGTLVLMDSKIDEEMAQGSVVKTLILALFASLFLGIILAFLSNSWDRIKADPASAARIESAWKAPKRK